MTESDVPAALRTAALVSALDKLPSFEGISFHGFAPGQDLPGRRTTISPVFVATSLDPRVATDNFSVDGLFAVIGNLGRDLSGVSQHPHEQEIVFRPGTMFLPLERFVTGGVTVTLVEQLDPDREPGSQPQMTLEEVRAFVEHGIAEALARSSVEDITVGKFVGGLG